MNVLVKTLSEISSLLAIDSARPVNLNPVAEKVVSCLGHERAFILLYSHQKDRLTAVASGNFSPSDFRKLDTPAVSDLFQQILDGIDESRVIRTAEHPELSFLSSAEKEVLAVAPIRSARKKIGILAAASESPERSDKELEILKLIAALIGQALRVEMAVLSEREKLREENQHLKQELKEKYDFSHIVGNSNAIRSVYDQVTQVAKSNATVLLRGESGTGKEMIANAIHYNSLRSKGPFIKLNCAALPDTLIESELFGHERGAFTGADRLKRGRFELAGGGTLFLDEIGDLPMQTQIKLLRVLQEREFERLGGTETIKSNIRLIAATNRDLERSIADGIFREDLYYRLNVFAIHLPPLR